MRSRESGNDPEAPGIVVTELILSWNNHEYPVNGDIVRKAFDKSGCGAVSGPHARYYLEVSDDIKSMEEVFMHIVPIPHDEFSLEMANLANEIFEALGFTVLDRDKHHES